MSDFKEVQKDELQESRELVYHASMHAFTVIFWSPLIWIFHVCHFKILQPYQSNLWQTQTNPKKISLDNIILKQVDTCNTKQTIGGVHHINYGHDHTLFLNRSFIILQFTTLYSILSALHWGKTEKVKTELFILLKLNCAHRFTYANICSAK